MGILTDLIRTLFMIWAPMANDRLFSITSELVQIQSAIYNGHPLELRNWMLNRWPLNTGSLKIFTGRGLMSIYHAKTLHARKNRTINTLSSDQYLKQSSVPINAIIYVRLCKSTVQ